MYVAAEYDAVVILVYVRREHAKQTVLVYAHDADDASGPDIEREYNIAGIACMCHNRDIPIIYRYIIFGQSGAIRQPEHKGLRAEQTALPW